MPVPDPASGGGPEMFEALGQTWTMEPINPGIRKKMSSWARMKARSELRAQQDEMTPAFYEERMASLDERITAGAYSWGSPLDPRHMGSGLMALLHSNEGQVELGRLLLEKHHPDLGARPDVGARVVVQILLDNPAGFAEALEGALGTGPVPNAPAPLAERERARETPTETPTGTPVA